MKTKLAKVLVLLAVITALVATMAMPAMAAGETVSVTGAEGVSVSVDSNGSAAQSNGTVTVTAKGSLMSKKTAIVTITNTSGSTAAISFDYSIDKASSHSEDVASGSKNLTLKAGDSYQITITSNSGFSNLTVTLKLSNFAIKAAAASSNVTVTYGSLGSVKIGDTTVASGSVNSVSSATGASFVAVPGSGSKFIGWIDPATNAVISTSATYQVIPAEDMAIRAVFANASSAPVFWANGTSYLFESLDAAISYASSASNKVVITLASDGTLPAGNYTIPAGITLNIPYDTANTLCTTKETVTTTENYTTPSIYRTLNMASGAKLTVNGAMSLSGQVSAKYQYNGMPQGPLPFIKMADSSKITVESGGSLYVYGFITGSGSVEVKSGGTVYECFQIADYRGGDATTQIVGKDDEYGVFPFNQYYIQNVEVPMTLHAGATELGYTAIFVSYVGVQKSDVPFIGNDDSMFVLDSGYVVKDYIEKTGRLSVEIHGNVSVSKIDVSMKVSTLAGPVKIDSSKYALPIAQHLTISVESGNISMDQSVAFLPGSELYIKEGATCTLGSGKKIIVYDLDQWLYNSGANGYSGTANKPYVALKYVPGGNGTTGRLKDALVQVDGTVDASLGAIYVTDGGANIYSTGTGIINTTPGTETVTYQVITNSTDIGSWPSIAIKPAVLKDADSTEVAATVAGLYTYYASTGKWCTPSHRYESVVTAPTCIATGYTTHTCIACGSSYTDSETQTNPENHTAVVIDAAVEATCSKVGLTEGSHCDHCGEVIVAQENIPSVSHTEATDAAVDATCTESGLTEGKHCTVCGEIMVAQEVIPAAGHTEVIDAAVAATCTATGLTEGKHCSVCDEVILAQEETPALDHSYGNWTVVTAPTYTTVGQKIRTCPACGGTETEQIAVLEHPVSSMGICLYDNIGVRFDLKLNDGDVVTAAVAGENAEIAQGEDGYYYVYVAAAQMTDEIAISVNGMPLAKTYTVRGYADVLLADTQYSNYYALVKNMLVYGGAAQEYFDYNNDAVEDLAGNGITGTSNAVPESAEKENSVTGRVSGIQFYGASLVYRNKIAVRFYFTGNAEGLSFVSDGVECEVVSNEAGDMHYVEFDNILPQDLDEQITLTVSDSSSSLTVVYGPMNYIVRMNAKGSDTMKALVLAMYNYYLEAEALAN